MRILVAEGEKKAQGFVKKGLKERQYGITGGGAEPVVAYFPLAKSHGMLYNSYTLFDRGVRSLTRR